MPPGFEKYLHAFNLVDGMSYVPLRRIFLRFRDFRAAWTEGRVDQFVESGVSRDLAEKIVAARAVFDADREYARLWDADIRLITRGNVEYPALLSQIHDPPFSLYRKGKTFGSSPHVAVVGTRMPSFYGQTMAHEISGKIAACGGVIVSGLAFGIDAIAHRAAVKAGVQTVAVLASGIGKITPSSHARLADEILASGGTIISEYANDEVSYKGRFLERNRIISGLCAATIVIEAKEKSGALITARHAFEQDRDVYALVGDITRPQAQGCLNLIRDDAARPVTGIAKLLEDLGLD
ncbi:MAG TPA: DNA-processing protein DprA, partial [Candidatus Gracilibacteria bacterium]|nr:DNA-processing protein DprA [Candidatus Gracilibacteria bacterium]